MAGRIAALFEWTDGVADIASWFVVFPKELIEFECVGPGLFDRNQEIDPRDSNPRELGLRILMSIRWIDE